MDYRERINDPLETMRTALSGAQSEIWTALPGIIQSVDLGAITCTVQPAIQAVEILPGQAERNHVNLPLLVDVPIFFPRGGGYTITFPVKPGDECLLVFSSRCIDNWWDKGGVQRQYEQRMHDLSDAFALVGPFSQSQKISSVSSTTTQFRSDDGAQFVEIDTPNKKIRAVSDGVIVELDSSANNVNVIANTKVNITAPITLVTGNLQVTGSIYSGYGTGNQVGLHTHVHTQSNDSRGDTEVPTNPALPGS